MNQTFSLSRFGRLLRQYFTDNRGHLLANLGLLVGGFSVLGAFFYQGLPGNVKGLRTVLFFLLIWAGWYVFTVQQTAVLNQKERAMNYLMHPASQFEKIVLIWLISGVGFISVYVATFALIDTAGVWYVNNRNWSSEKMMMIRQLGEPLKLNSFFNAQDLSRLPVLLWALTALIHPFTLALSLFIRRYTLPLVVVVAFGILVLGYLGNNALLHLITGSDAINSASPFSQANAQSPSDQYNFREVELPQPLSNQIRYTVGVIVLILLYCIAYVRLKEREV